MALCGVIPMMFVAFYSVNDTFAGNDFVFVGATWFKQVLASRDFHWALLRSLGFALLMLAVQVPLGLYIALRMPASGLLSAIYIVLMAVPLLTPSVVVGYLWKVLTTPTAGLVAEGFGLSGIAFNMNNSAFAWAALALMDTWHWTSLVVLLCFAGLRAIPDDFYRAARIDGASPWAIFRYVQLPKLRHVLLIAMMLRFMDSFMIYAEAYVVTRGGPGVSTTFLSHELVQTALVQFDLGEGGAMSIIYFLIVLTVSWVFFRLIAPRTGVAQR
jgi:glycerol transport system permease protein